MTADINDHGCEIAPRTVRFGHDRSHYVLAQDLVLGVPKETLTELVKERDTPVGVHS